MEKESLEAYYALWSPPSYDEAGYLTVVLLIALALFCIGNVGKRNDK